MSESVKYRCTGCTAPIDVDARITRGFCQYCGTPYSINDSVYERLFLQKQQEQLLIEREERIEKKIEKLKEKRNHAMRKICVLGICCIGISIFCAKRFGEAFDMMLLLVATFGIVLLTAGIGITYENYEEEINNISGKIKYAPNLRPENVQIVQKRMRDLGFTNITIVPLNDLHKQKDKKIHMVSKITADGIEMDGGAYSSQAAITIYYHSLA